MITIGADPEFFVVDRQSGSIVPACGRFGGTKEKPIIIPRKHNYDIRYHEDNVALELGFKEQTNIEAFTRVVTYAIDSLENLCEERGLMLCRDDTSSYEFGTSELQSPDAQRFGCDPDFDAYTGGQQRSNIPDFENWRFTGGHIHLGGKFNCPPFVVAMFMDIAVGLTLGQSAVNACDRRGMWYGQPGIFRPKPYGIEYRTPTSNWCLLYTRTYRVAHNSWVLGKYLEKTSATQLKKDFQAVDWFKIRSILTTPFHQTDVPDNRLITQTLSELHAEHAFIRKLEFITGD